MFMTSESVSSGHPDKVADQISDAILDECLKQDEFSRVACETLLTTGLVIVAGEITTQAYVDVRGLVRAKLLEIGYDAAEKGMDGNSCGVMVAIDEQSPDISQGVGDSSSKIIGAGDQGMMVGYAVDETAQYLPLPVDAAHYLMREQEDLRRDMFEDVLWPDGKCQVTVEYSLGKVPTVTGIVLSMQHNKDVERDALVKIFYGEMLKDFPYPVAKDMKLWLNPTGRFVVGGPHGDTGLTGRKLMVDTYGSIARHGGGAFSGKDPTKVDRSAAYAARQLAKAIVYGGLAGKVEVQIAYAIGIADPVSLTVDSGNVDLDLFLSDKIAGSIDLTPAGIINRLGLRKFNRYQDTAVFGAFTDNAYPWESQEGLDAILDVIS